MIHLFKDKYTFLTLPYFMIITLILFQNFTIFSLYIFSSSSCFIFFSEINVFTSGGQQKFILYVEIKTIINHERGKEKTFLRFDGILEKLTEYRNLRFY